MKSFCVPGIPVAKGSAKAFYNRKLGRAMVIQDNRERQKPWASLISYHAQEAGCKPMDGGVCLTLQFVMPRPKAHYGTGKNATRLKEPTLDFHIVKPDLDKLIRCVKDALTGVAWHDDSQVCLMREVWKRYGDIPGVEIEIKYEVGRESLRCRKD
jgi:Holliday junction resolvase RusA-like endonuclease